MFSVNPLKNKWNNNDICLLLDDSELRDPSDPLTSEERPLQNGSLDHEGGHRSTVAQKAGVGERKAEEEKRKQKKKYARLSMLRRRRCATRKEDESDLSEGFESDEEEEEEQRGCVDSGGGASGPPLTPSTLGKESKSGREHPTEEGTWESGSEEDEEGGTAFDVETDSDMNSQESRSDLEDIEDSETPENLDTPPRGEVQPEDDDEEEDEQADPREDGDGDTPPATNGPLLPSDPSISSNLQAMSSQLFQAKRCFRLAPTFSNVLLRPHRSATNSTPNPTDPDTASTTPSQETPPPPGDSPCDAGPGTANGTNDNGQ